jgi:HSP20 family protein
MAARNMDVEVKKSDREKKRGLPTTPPTNWIEAIRRDMERWMGPTFVMPRIGGLMEGWQTPRTDIKDAGDHYELVAEVPGIPKEKVEVSTQNGRLEIRAQEESSKHEEDEGFFHKEIGRRTYYRSLSMPEDGDLEHADASLKDGCLFINVPKKDTNNQRHKIPVG